MKVVQTTEFEVLGPLTQENRTDIEQRIQQHVNVDHTIPDVFADNGFYVLLGDDNTARPVHPSDYAANYESVDGNTLDRLEEEFSVSDLAMQGELHTEEVWQCWEAFSSDVANVPAQWWDAQSEKDARARTTNGKIRMRRDITVNSAWTYYEVQS